MIKVNDDLVLNLLISACTYTLCCFGEVAMTERLLPVARALNWATFTRIEGVQYANAFYDKQVRAAITPAYMTHAVDLAAPWLRHTNYGRHQ